MEAPAIAVGKTLPSRKLMSMFGQHSLKDPSFSEQLWEAKFASICAAGTSSQDLLEFTDLFYELLGDCPETLFSAQQIQRKYMVEVKRCTHWQVKKDAAAFESLHPNDPAKRWEYWAGLLRRLADAELHRTQVQADIKASMPVQQANAGTAGTAAQEREGTTGSAGTPDGRGWRRC